MRIIFDEQLALLNHNLIEFGMIIQTSISNATKSLINKDRALAKEVIKSVDEINDKEKEIESLCLKLLLQQQPVAKDLRLISSALKMITDMKRIGVQSADIAELCIYLASEEYIKKLEHIPQMAYITSKMLKESIEAFVKKDLPLAKDVINCDDEVDDLFKKVKNDLFELIKINVENGKQALDLLMIAKYYEKIGDHTVNIARWVIFSITGKHERK